MARLNLDQFVTDCATAVEAVDARRPVARNARTALEFLPGIGPHSEAATIGLIMDELARRDPSHYASFASGVPYPLAPRQKCDLCLGDPASWALEFKLLRLLGDNGNANDNMLMHILSPYPQHRSALTDCDKLASSGFTARKGIVILGYETATFPLRDALSAFEILARHRVSLGDRVEAHFSGLVHPIHTKGSVVGWEVTHSAPG
jgi:hypothetical protein